MARVPEHQGPNAARRWCALLTAIAPRLAPRLATRLARGLALTVLIAASPACAGEVGRPLPRPAPGAGAPPPACRYTITLINSPLMCGSQPESGNAKAIAADGTVAGERYCSASSRRPFLWSVAGGYQAIAGPPGSSDSHVAAMNDLQEIVGTGNFPQIRGYWRSAAGSYQVLGVPPTGTISEAHGVNDLSTVVGMWGNQITGPGRVPCLWQDGVLTDLTTLLGAPQGEANAINSSNQITGWSGTSIATDARAFILDGGQVEILPPIPGGFTSVGLAINEARDVVGYGSLLNPSGSGPNVSQAYGFFAERAINLGTLPTAGNTFAFGINATRVVVGTAGSRAWVWQSGAMRNLNDLISSPPFYTIKVAYDIRDDGVIVAGGTLGGPSGPSRGFLLMPVYPSMADFNGDCLVNGQDLAMLLGEWGPTGPTADSSADLNQDGFVNGIDLALLLGEWG